MSGVFVFCFMSLSSHLYLLSQLPILSSLHCPPCLSSLFGTGVMWRRLSLILLSCISCWWWFFINLKKTGDWHCFRTLWCFLPRFQKAAADEKVGSLSKNYQLSSKCPRFLPSKQLKHFFKVMFPKVCSAGYSQVDFKGAPTEWQFCGGVLRKRDTCDFRQSSSCHHHREDSYRGCCWTRAGWGGGGGPGIPKQQYQSHILSLHSLLLAHVSTLLHPVAAFPLLFPTVVFVINIFSLGGIGPKIDKHNLDYCKCE